MTAQPTGSTAPAGKARHLFFDHPLFEEFARALLTLDQCPLGEVAATAAPDPGG